MADEEPESFISKMAREVRLSLNVEGGRVFMHHADPENLDRCTIELKCAWSPFLRMFELFVHIGDDKHKPLKWDDDGVEVVDEDAEDVVGWSLSAFPIMLSLYRVDEKWMSESAAKNEGEPILGRFDYNAPMKTDDGVVNDKRPTVTAWVGVGAENFDLIRARLLEAEKPDFDMGIDVQFPRGSVESGGSITKRIHWDGNGSLPIASAVVVWKRGDWDSRTDRWREVLRPRPPKEYEPPREHVELLGAVDRLHATMVKLTAPVWIAAGAAVVVAIKLAF